MNMSACSAYFTPLILAYLTEHGWEYRQSFSLKHKCPVQHMCDLPLIILAASCCE